VASFQHEIFSMTFSERLATLRKDRGLTQLALAEKAAVHVAQIRRYEAGQTQPALDVIRRIAIALNVSADVLIFDKDERGPGDDLRLQFEAIEQMSPEERKIIKTIIESMIIRHDAQRWLPKENSG
jgi:transcriptional regulator with XRE-family HTH domain